MLFITSRPWEERCLTPTILLLTLTTATTAGEVLSSFDTSDQGWRIVNYPFRSHSPNPATTNAVFDASFGRPAGSLRTGDVYGETGVAAPVAYLGDKSTYYGGTLSYDMYLRYTDSATYPAVVLNAGTMSLYYDTPSPPLNEWSTRTIVLLEDGWRVSSSGVPASAAQLVFVLANLQGLYIYTEWHTGSDDTSTDNVRLTEGACAFVPDFDHDCDVDHHDVMLFSSCFTGPSIPYDPDQLPQGCAFIADDTGLISPDLDHDHDIDQSDFGILQRCYSGEEPADPLCAD